MELPDGLKPPTWLLEPDKFADSLDHSQYYSGEFNSMVNIQDTSKFASGIRSFLYWRRQLIASVTNFTVMFCLIGKAGLMPLNVINVMAGALRTFCLEKAIEFSQGANSNFLAISFASEGEAELFRSSFKYFGEAVLGFVKPAPSSAVRYSLLWLPPLFDINKVRGLLKRYCDDFTTIKGSISLGQGQYKPSSVIRGELTLRAGVCIEDLPHLIPLPQPHRGYALLIVDGRDPFCLRCLKKGHLRKGCTRPKCNVCHFYHHPNEMCDGSSYAAKVSKSPGAVQQYCWVDDVSVPIEVELEVTSHVSDSPQATSDSLVSDNIIGPSCNVPKLSKNAISLPNVDDSSRGCVKKKEVNTDSDTKNDNQISSDIAESFDSDSGDSDELLGTVSPKSTFINKEQPYGKSLEDENSVSAVDMSSDVSVWLESDRVGIVASSEPTAEDFSDLESITPASSGSDSGRKRLKVEALMNMDVDSQQELYDLPKGRELRSSSKTDIQDKGGQSKKRNRNTNSSKSQSHKVKS